MAKDNEGRCYELALLAIVSGKHGENAKLVHGYPRLQQPGRQKYGHAWIEFPDDDGIVMVWDPITDKTYLREVYYAVGQIEELECTYYTAEQAVEAAQEAGDGEMCSSGPWHNVPDDALFEPSPNRWLFPYCGIPHFCYDTEKVKSPKLGS